MDSKIKQWVDAHTDEFVKDIQSLVKIPSVSVKQKGEHPYGEGCYRALQQFLALGEQYGFTTQNYDNHCGSISYGQGEKSLGMWGHLDVVPEGGGWIHPPFGETYLDDHVIGRGVADNKGPAVAALYALRFMKENNINLSYKLQAMGGCDEEVGMNDIDYFLANYSAPDYSLVFDAGFPICYGEKGLAEVFLTALTLTSVLEFYGGDASNKVPEDATVVLSATPEHKTWAESLPKEFTVTQQGDTLRIGAKGQSGHVASPKGAVNAIGLLAEQLKTLPALTPQENTTLELLSAITNDGYGVGLGIDQEDEVSGELTCAGSVLRHDATQLTLTLNIRYPITSKFEDILAVIETKARSHGYGVEVERNRNPHYKDPNEPWLQTLLQIYAEETGDDSPPYTMGGGTYASKLPNAIVYGPGMAVVGTKLEMPEGHGGGHAPDEAQSVPTLQKALEIYIKALLALDGTL